MNKLVLLDNTRPLPPQLIVTSPVPCMLSGRVVFTPQLATPYTPVSIMIGTGSVTGTMKAATLSTAYFNEQHGLPAGVHALLSAQFDVDTYSDVTLGCDAVVVAGAFTGTSAGAQAHRQRTIANVAMYISVPDCDAAILHTRKVISQS